MNRERGFLPAMEAVVRSGQSVSVPLAGNSMMPFLKNGRDTVVVSKLDQIPERGDIVFYRRPSGQYVMHRVHHIRSGMLYIVGDAHTEIEGPISPEAVFGIVRKVIRKGKPLSRGSFCWWFFETVWIRMVPLRRPAMRCYGMISRIIRQR